ncbi:hypothetical protein GQ457_15G002960 [Hibiscus cannabinus]
MLHKWTLYHELHTELSDSNYHQARKKSSLHAQSFASQRFSIQFSTFRDPTSTVNLPPPKQSASMKICNAHFTASNTAYTNSGCKACPETLLGHQRTFTPNCPTFSSSQNREFEALTGRPTFYIVR